jgi:putative phosphoribosyl transferase
MIPMLPFKDRATAGAGLASRLIAMDVSQPVVLALPRGGVPVARQVADALHAPLDLVLVRKIGVPWQPELAAAAVVDGEEANVVLNEEVMGLTEIGMDQIQARANEELLEIERRRTVYLGDRAPVPLEGRTAILVDDGIATGTTVRAAVVALRRRNPSRIVLAVPVAAAETLAALRGLVDDIVCLATPEPFGAIGYYYRDFHQLSDKEVSRLIAGGHDRN